MSTPLRPFVDPPVSPGHGTLKSPRTQSLSDISNIPVFIDPPQSPSYPEKEKIITMQEPKGRAALASIRCPTVVLEASHITSMMAATLAKSLLGHILFLKSQVPFPVVQLARMPIRSSNSKAAKRRAELLSAYDTLSSHLQTTFSALSTAYSRKKTRNGPVRSENVQTREAHMMFVVGPSVGAPKARIIMVVDGLEVKLCGVQDGVAGDENAYKAWVDEARKEKAESDTRDDEGSESDNDEESASEDGSDGPPDSDTDPASEPPVSRSPSPSPPTSDEPEPKSSPNLPPALASRPIQKPRASVAQIPLSSTRLSAHPRSRHSTPVSGPTYAEEQQTLRAAERLLSRTLANACAEENGGMSAELGPTQTYILLHAPRRFAHPAWLPRQNIVRATDAALEAFLEDTAASEIAQAKKAKATRGVETEGVWLGCRSSVGTAELHHDDDEESEEDEMIWWVWDGKIHGFADW